MRCGPIPIPAGYRETIVTPKSSRHVDAYWSFIAKKAGQSVVLPDGHCDIILEHNAVGAEPPTPIITGPATQPYTVQYAKGDCWLGIRLRPGYGVSVWRQKLISASDTVLRGKEALTLLPALNDLQERNLNLENLSKITEASTAVQIDHRLALALEALHVSGGRMRINTIATMAGCTARQINRMFRANVGLSTKIYAQLVQFHRALRLVHSEQLPPASAAFECGYSDQAHLTRAFRRFGGFSPSNIPQDLSQPELFSPNVRFIQD